MKREQEGKAQAVARVILIAFVSNIARRDCDNLDLQPTTMVYHNLKGPPLSCLFHLHNSYTSVCSADQGHPSMQGAFPSSHHNLSITPHAPVILILICVDRRRRTRPNPTRIRRNPRLLPRRRLLNSPRKRRQAPLHPHARIPRPLRSNRMPQTRRAAQVFR